MVCINIVLEVYQMHCQSRVDEYVLSTEKYVKGLKWEYAW